MSDSAFFAAGALFSTDYLNEGIKESAAYRGVDVVDLRVQLEAIAASFPQNARTNESQTEDDFIFPVLAALGWSEFMRQQNLTVTGRDDVPDGLLFSDASAKSTANAQRDQWQRYAHGLAVVECKRWSRPLDRAFGRAETTAPSTQMLRYLRRLDDITGGKLRWGILTNGLRWRLYWAGARSISEEFLEVDLGRVLALGERSDLFADETARDHWLRVFAVMFGRQAFLRDGVDQRSLHDRARAEAAFYEERVAASLSNVVFEQVFPDLAKGLAESAPDAPMHEIRDAALVLLYRLLFLLYAEDRNLLPVNDDRYDDYALRPLRLEVGERVTNGDAFSTTAARFWSHISDLSRMIDKGDSSVGIPPYNGGLFATSATPLLASARISDSIMAPALDALSYERASGQRRYINYRDLSVQQLGSIYERLLEFEIVREPFGDIDYLAVRPNLFARKNSGSYYTPEELVGLILDEALKPLITERLEAFRSAQTALSEEGEDQKRRILREVDPAEAILSLRVCDPAMGSGHFLVSLVDTLADHVLDAMAEAAVLGAGLNYNSPLADKIEDIRGTILKNARAANWTIDEGQLDDRHIIRRMVLKRCVYGVDKNPMAVELAKVALWLHTFTVGAPLSFIDHHLHTGDSLFGFWVRDAIDKASSLGGELFYNEALRNAQRSAEAMKTIEALTDVEIGEAHRSAAMYEDIELMTGELDGFVSFIHALDWLDLKSKSDIGLIRLWLDGRFGEPIPIARGRKAPQTGMAKPDEVEAFTAIWRRARELISEERFLNWQISFPGVWNSWASTSREGGFDAVVGNPPWDRIKLQQVEWFAARRPAIARAQRASDRARMITKLRSDGDPLFEDFVKADMRAADGARVARGSGHYPLLSRGDINLYSLFVERSHALAKPTGMIGLLVPSGIASDLSASAFFRKIATHGHLKALYDFENRRPRYGLEPFFPDVDSRFKFCALVTSPSRQFDQATCGFFLQAASEVADPDKVFSIRATDFASVNPNTGTAPIFRSQRDMEIITAIYARLPVLVDRSSGTPVAAWPLRYATMFHMTNDSHLFRTRTELEELEGAWEVGGNWFESSSGRWAPLYTGRMIHQFDHRAASVTVNEMNLHNTAQSAEVTAEMKADPTFLPTPQYWVPESIVANTTAQSTVIVFRDIARPTDARTMIAALVPRAGFGNKAPLLLSRDATLSDLDKALIVANLNSVIFDYIIRSKVQGASLNWFILEQLPIVPQAHYSRRFGHSTAADIVRKATLELSYTAHDLAALAYGVGYLDAEGKVLPPFIWDDDRRLTLRAKLDAIYFILYGVFDPCNITQSREDIRYIYSTFPIVEREETERWGTYRSRELCLAWINALIAGQPDAPINSH
ncbi:Eco57I restriction-modification methylase domain-containing protein [Mesorhizobium sp. B1-1-8]|uniref:Eco57I restriction-modification methylase domain-containing protein n=1 Tax=Mesorhizobium sp. B1-1-8 TaxID=2589976 RepID=UPI00112A2973|nr:restriction endonuclease [Mesorhizobium sp. B1-1-8]UCI08026.1 BREX-1 system adenine-specific DNA-methyltransferase PglX [Mesorhizobium sp. B1-1-8]